jgi:hypothetical protein
MVQQVLEKGKRKIKKPENTLLQSARGWGK